jgi:hypothetical protein
MTISQFPIPAGGIPTGDTAGRPASPVIGDVYYNGETAVLEIFDGTNFIPCSAPAGPPTIAVADVGTSVAYGSAQGAVTITPSLNGGNSDSFIISASTGGYTATTTGTTVTITVGNNGSYTFSGQGQNTFGTSVAGPSTSATLTTVPEAPTIGAVTTNAGTTDITVNWTLNSDGGKNLSAITVTPFLDGTTAETATTAATTSSTSATIVGLTQGSAYTFKVKTTNANGTGLDSSASSSITIPSNISVDYLVVAGGGGGGADSGGGGGGGGMRCTVTGTGGGGSLESPLSILAGTNVTVTVGAGGNGSSDPYVLSSNGGQSVFSTITSAGGGYGGSNNAPDPGVLGTPGDGGSGGGAGGGGTGSGPHSGGAADPSGQGFAGGDSFATGAYPNRGGGGGGGAAGVGSNSTGNSTANGGAGRATSITGSSVTYSVGGTGVGATGGTQSATPGANSGGGGSGCIAGGTVQSGGSGVVILRWLTADGSITVGAGLTADATGTDGSYSYKRFTAGSGNVSFS